MPVTVRRAGEPRFPATVVDEPDGTGDVVSGVFALKWRAAGDGVLHARISYASVDGDGTQTVIAEDLPMTRSGDVAAGCHLWDVSLLGQGNYYVFVEVFDEAGHSHGAYNEGALTIARQNGVPITDEHADLRRPRRRRRTGRWRWWRRRRTRPGAAAAAAWARPRHGADRSGRGAPDPARRRLRPARLASSSLGGSLGRRLATAPTREAREEHDRPRHRHADAAAAGRRRRHRRHRPWRQAVHRHRRGRPRASS